MTTYAVTHETRYRYSAPVSASYGEAYLLPRPLDRQRCLEATLTIGPQPEDRSERVDAFGNRVTYFQVTEAHEELVVTASSTVEVIPGAGVVPLDADRPWEQVRDAVAGATGALAVDASPFVVGLPDVEPTAAARRYAAEVFAPGRPVLDAVGDLARRIHADFTFDPTATDVTSTIEHLFEVRAGVCQDFAHLFLACVRAVGLPGRYVSGYLETVPPPGEERLVGADVSHAWAGVLLPDVGWVDVDPTNDQFVDDRYITVAWGRGYRDVAPLKGVVFSDSRETSLEVRVDVARAG